MVSSQVNGYTHHSFVNAVEEDFFLGTSNNWAYKFMPIFHVVQDLYNKSSSSVNILMKNHLWVFHVFFKKIKSDGT